MSPPSATPHPRVHRAEWALARFGQLASRSFAALERCDPPADALVEWLAADPERSKRFDLAAAWRDPGGREPPAIAELFESVREVPAWVDWVRVERARRLFERTGLFGGFVLSLRALIGGYVAPAGNKPLAFSGRLREQAPRRVAETARFVTAVCAPGGMRPGAPGWLIALRVRLIHAQVRRLLWASGRWDRASWAMPINQHDMLATTLLFSEVYVEGLRVFGFDVSEEEGEDWVHLWNFVGWVMGTEAELLPRDYAEAAALRELIQWTQGPPDDDSRALAAALLGTPPTLPGGPAGQLARLRAGMVCGISRMLIGDEVADQLGIDRAPVWSRLLPVIPNVVGASEWARVHVPELEGPLRRAGAKYWAWVVEMSLRGEPARFARPDQLAGAR
ncbi:oxygenase MpaB family protein [Enhygromyxa salina]|uniref:Latex clearing protein n=1 Tax=Enhygromyxa salina TaxID=215803 RepID=A0A2S9YP08_9BACT|nr:oxygenase MpaB family protein [Enhygromyxa salina]PRQ06820.1 Latex clearing protein precursor [Enhygromyxa salina]